MTAFISGLIVTLGYYFYTTRKARRDFDARSRNQDIASKEAAQGNINKE
jgi:uncharacterized membrane protein